MRTWLNTPFYLSLPHYAWRHNQVQHAYRADLECRQHRRTPSNLPHLGSLPLWRMPMSVNKRAKLTQCPWSSFLSRVHPMFRNYVTCFSLVSQVLVTLELPMHPHPPAADCTLAHYTTALSHDVVYLPILFLACKPWFRLFLARESSL